MKVLLQRVRSAQVVVNDDTIGEIETGLLLLVGFGADDENAISTVVTKACDKLLNLRVFPNKSGKLDHSVLDINGGILAIPQFTLLGSCNKGRRPDFSHALAPSLASPAFDTFVSALSEQLEYTVETGRFGADMQVSLINDGPLTLMLEF